jgi:tetratricopeptide (TPR) repeat protein
MAGPVTSSLAPSVVAGEQRAREFLAQKQWRKARDELKPLTKIDRPRFLPLLIKANIGLSREMMAKGQVAEAQQVLSYLATIATSDQLRAVDLEMTSQMEPTAGSADKLAGELAAANATRTESEKLRLADKLVLTFQELGAGVVRDERMAAELRAVHEALLAASMQQWDRLPDILRPIAHRSVFAHWSAFIKGLAAFHTGESERAVRFFENLPSGTVPAKASQVYLLWLHPWPAQKGGRPPSEIVLEGAGRLLGQPGAGRLLLRADQLWKKEDHEQSYRVLRDALTGFPVRDLTWLGTLTDFYFNAAHFLPEADRDAYVEYLEDLVIGSATKNGIEEMLSYRLQALENDDRRDWEGYLRLHERLYQADPRFASLVYGHLGRSFATMEANPFGFGRPELVDGPAAVACLRKAIELDPNNLEAHLALVHVHTALRQARECNRLLDRMVEQFPEEKRVLVDAAISCVDREAYVKGLDYLERARRLDQLDPRIPDLIVLARHRLAEQSFRQKRPEKAHESVAATEPFLTDKPEDFRRSRWTARLHQALMELSWGDAVQGEKLLEEARAASPFPAAFLLFAHLACRPARSGGGDATPYWAELAKTVRSAPQVGHLELLVRIIDHWQSAAKSNQLAATERLVRQCLPVACGQPFTREEARRMVELRLADPRWRTDLVILVKKVLRSDPMDPLFRVYKFLLQGDSTAPSPQNRKELNALLQEAGRRGDDATAQRIQHLIKRLEAPPRPSPHLDELEMDDFDEDDLPPEFADPALNYPPLNLPPSLPRELAEIAKLLALMSDSELEGAKRTRPKGMPAAIFDSLVDLARGQQRPPRPKPGKQKNTPSGWVPPASPRDEEGPDQLNLL